MLEARTLKALAEPTPLGWAVTAAIWLAVLWLLAWLMARLVKSDRAAPPRAGL